MTIKAVIFDCDGLMFNTERYSIQVWKDEAEKAGISLPSDFFDRITGSGGEKTLAYIESCGLKDILPIIHNKRFDLDYLGSVPKDSMNMKGLIEIFTYLNQKGYRIAIASSSPDVYVQTLLSRVSVPLHYDALVGGNRVRNSKPNPEIFLLAAEALHTRPEECLVLEDSKAGILAAKNAGMRSVFIEDTVHPDEEMKEAIDLQADSLLGVIDLLEKM